MKWMLCLFILLTGCAAKEPSQMIAKAALSEIAGVQETVRKIETQTPAECKTDVFLANLEAINRQVAGIGWQIESIGLSCQTEKQVLEERIVARNVMIFGLGVLVLVLGWFRFKRN